VSGAKLFAAVFVLFTPVIHGQGLDPADLLQLPTNNWPTYNGDYSGRRYSPLSSINQTNVTGLSLGWAFQTRSELKSTPLEVNGVLYFTAPDHVWAIDARTGHPVWHFNRPSTGNHIAQRGVAMYKGRLYFGTTDAHILCLDARTGKVIWDVTIADSKFGYYLSVAPLVIKDKLILGSSGDVADVPHFIEAISPEDGRVLWRWNTVPDEGAPGSNSWPNAEARTHGGGPAWLPGTYDPELNLLYWGTGNPHPVLAGTTRPGDNLYTCSIVALDPDTGHLVWSFQPSPHDTHDWDAVETPVLFDAEFVGKPLKLLAQASRNGYFFLLDRTNGHSLLTAPYVPVDWASHIGANGEPVPEKTKEPQPDGSLVRAAFDGATNWMAPSYDPQTQLFYVNAETGFTLYYLELNQDGRPAGHQGGAANHFWTESLLEAIDYKTGKIKWSIDQGQEGGFSGILTTAGHLLFTGDVSGNVLAIDPADGRILWHTYVGGNLNSSPMTYELDGKQYVLTLAGNVVYAWTLQ
jgi:alcohol dehydrogenase (cytochrome c)